MSIPRPGLLAAFLCLVLGGGFAIGYVTTPGAWYAALNKPSFTPPGWLFPLAWSALYVLIAIAGWRTFMRDPSSRAMKLWWLQLGLNFLWPVVFFVAHQIGFAFAIIMLLLAVIVTFMSGVRSQDGMAAALFAPYAVWVTFAAVLNGYIFAANP
jgi:tryptophan-rich sensory protein